MSKLTLTFILAFWSWLSLMPESRADICMHNDADESDSFYLSNTTDPQDCAWRVTEATIQANHTKLRSLPYQEMIASAAKANALEPALLHAVIKTESGYQPKAVSSRGAKGLMQLMPATARQLGITDIDDPAQNVLAGARYLSQLQQQFHGDITLTLAAYNAGPGAVSRYGNTVPPYAETQAYVPKVLQTYQQLKVDF